VTASGRAKEQKMKMDDTDTVTVPDLAAKLPVSVSSAS
jgi:hypothetical protein